ncbi:MAG: aspartate/glutamate racemase family protein [Oscillospiraceae bacterium]|nr:aspartate/glutamate racemase family protein [Oscillospiraceae bacterium]
MTRRRLGVLGGMGPAASALFYQMVTERTEASCDQEHIDLLLWSCASMPDRTACLLTGRKEELYQKLLSEARLLERAGCTALAIPCNTSHVFAPRLERDLTIPLVNMVEAAADEAKRRGWRKAAIFATDGTVQNGLYQKACAARDIDALVPEGAVQRQVMRVIYDRVKAGSRVTMADMAPLLNWREQMGCDGAILACTELSLARRHLGLDRTWADAMAALADAAILACGGRLKKG